MTRLVMTNFIVADLMTMRRRVSHVCVRPAGESEETGVGEAGGNVVRPRRGHRGPRKGGGGLLLRLTDRCTLTSLTGLI